MHAPWNKGAPCRNCGGTERYKYGRCKACQRTCNAAVRERAKTDPELRARIRVYAKRGGRKLHGRPTPTHPDPGYCECCSTTVPGGMGGFHEDHDHLTGKFRGWICMKCNRGIGYLGDDIDGMLRAIDYLYLANEESKGQEVAEAA